MELFLQLLVNGLFVGCIYALLALSFSIIFSPVRFWHFAHGAVFASAGYFAFLSKVVLGLPLIVASLMTILFSALLGMVIELTIYKPLRRLGAGPMTLLISSMGIFVFIDNMNIFLFGSNPKALGVYISTYHIGFITVTSHQVITLTISCIIFAIILFILHRTKVGLALRAVSSNPSMAAIIGLDPDRIRLMAFGLGSAVVSVPAILLVIYSGARPGLGSIGIFTAAISMIVGGVGSILGAIPGGMLLGISENLGVWKLETYWQSAISFGILIFFILVKPAGFFGEK